VTLVFKIDKDTDSILRFDRVGKHPGIIVDIGGPFAVDFPTRILVPCQEVLSCVNRTFAVFRLICW
jgi:hypothetical protein